MGGSRPSTSFGKEYHPTIPAGANAESIQEVWREWDLQLFLTDASSTSLDQAPWHPEPLAALMLGCGNSAMRFVQFRCRKDTIATEAATQPHCIRFLVRERAATNSSYARAGTRLPFRMVAIGKRR